MAPPNHKPLDRQIKTSEQVNESDCGFIAKVVNDGINKDHFFIHTVKSLQDSDPNGSFMICDFTEMELMRPQLLDSVMIPMCMKYMIYPQRYANYPILSLEIIYHFLKCSDQHQIVLLCICERWKLLAFMLAAFLLYQKRCTCEEKALELTYSQLQQHILDDFPALNYKASQKRYLRYITTIGSNSPPSDTPLIVDYLVVKNLPSYYRSRVCTKIHFYGQDPSFKSKRDAVLLFTTSTLHKTDTIRFFDILGGGVQGDIVLNCIFSLWGREVLMFQAMFNTAFVHSNVLVFGRDDVDTPYGGDKDTTLPSDFKLEIHFTHVEEFFDAEEQFNNVVDMEDEELAHKRLDKPKMSKPRPTQRPPPPLPLPSRFGASKPRRGKVSRSSPAPPPPPLQIYGTQTRRSQGSSPPPTPSIGTHVVPPSPPPPPPPPSRPPSQPPPPPSRHHASVLPSNSEPPQSSANAHGNLPYPAPPSQVNEIPNFRDFKFEVHHYHHHYHYHHTGPGCGHTPPASGWDSQNTAPSSSKTHP